MRSPILLAAVILAVGIPVAAAAAGSPPAVLQETFRLAHSASPELGWARLQRLQADSPGLPARIRLDLQQRLASQPADADGWFQLGLLQVVSGQPAEAATSFAKASQLRPIDPYGFAYQAYALLEAGDPLAAMSPLQTALRRDPGHRFANWVLAQALYRQGLRQQAARRLQSQAPLR